MTIERTVYVKLSEEIECIKLQDGLLILNELYFKKGEEVARCG
ncbi:hypothetical protein [Clostridium sp. 'deep sea']|nr:hypothetical protein [Clostridium sp. 'deep sea']